ncbi:MAG: hypothetical protein KKA62_04005 [Nanoarchaeota archaeon]|nr:hypothetical protein [Nanoarchaeota archaeon]MBU1643992.1 hypothetical protein [Nanoarchaeota archaeon]MBU1977087.1 hypothetical protein [Nanoarchaeota archaeon]
MNKAPFMYVKNNEGTKIFQLSSGLELLANMHNLHPDQEQSLQFDIEKQAQCIYIPLSELEDLAKYASVPGGNAQDSFLKSLDLKLKMCYGLGGSIAADYIDLYNENLVWQKKVKIELEKCK